MTVESVWGVIDGSDEIAVHRDGDTWTFGSIPLSKTGDVIVEVWAEDEAGNQGYRAGVLTLEKGAVKCFRWVTEYAVCTMRAIPRSFLIPGPPEACAMGMVPRTCELLEFRPVCTMRPHICSKVVS